MLIQTSLMLMLQWKTQQLSGNLDVTAQNSTEILMLIQQLKTARSNGNTSIMGVRCRCKLKSKFTFRPCVK